MDKGLIASKVWLHGVCFIIDLSVHANTWIADCVQLIASHGDANVYTFSKKLRAPSISGTPYTNYSNY